MRIVNAFKERMSMLNDPNAEVGQPPVPRSSVIKRVVWDQAVVRDVLGPVGKSGKRDGSDNFPITWAVDGNLYLAYGDGYGFEPMLPMKLGMGFMMRPSLVDRGRLHFLHRGGMWGQVSVGSFRPSG